MSLELLCGLYASECGQHRRPADVGGGTELTRQPATLMEMVIIIDSSIA